MSKEIELNKQSNGWLSKAGQGTSTRSEIAAFVQQAKQPALSQQRTRLIFALDATMSRQPTWDLACSYQGDMFDAAAARGGLDIQLMYFRGQGECGASKWVQDAGALSALMSRIQCRGGRTQIGKVLSHSIKAAKQKKIGALVYVGDAMEENPDHVCDLAAELAIRGTPVFLFHEGGEAAAAATFQEIARLTRGAYMPFDSGAASALRDLLIAVASFASGGRSALKALQLQGNGSAARLLKQLK